jgi:hypothetical protein
LLGKINILKFNTDVRKKMQTGKLPGRRASGKNIKELSNSRIKKD